MAMYEARQSNVSLSRTISSSRQKNTKTHRRVDLSAKKFPISRYIKITNTESNKDEYIYNIHGLKSLFPGGNEDDIAKSVLTGKVTEYNKNLLNRAINEDIVEYKINENNKDSIKKELRDYLLYKMISLAEVTWESQDADDGRSVEDEWHSELACTLYALLKIRPYFWGAKDPKELHEILRRRDETKQYDDETVCAKIRFVAGLIPKVYNKTLRTFLDSHSKDENDVMFIIDLEGQAHTFVLQKIEGKWKKFDNESPGGSDISVSNYNINVIRYWQ